MAISAFRRKKAERNAIERLVIQTRHALPELEPQDERFWALVRELPARQTQAITLFYLEDRSVLEIAEILGCSPATAKVHLFRGRQALAARLGLEAPDES
jgi:RNA polymerase sigma factor (sigma-70 family)